MAAPAKPPGSRLAPLLEWRAQRIHDPVERLRYLRKATEPFSFALPPALRRFGLGRVALTAVLWASFFIPSYTPSRARATGPSPLRNTLLGRVNYAAPQVWPVEKNAAFDLYSNGLRIENEFAVANRARVAYPVFKLRPLSPEPGDGGVPEWRTQPAGIVFHSTESLQAPFDPSEIRSLKRLGRNLLDYVRSQRSYHFVIDRFGRVFRIVEESDIANHAGRSVWSDGSGVYIHLNASFLSIAFESATDASQPLNNAQIHAAQVLADMLRSTYSIPASNCVTHAQVSINPSNMRIGYHTDWAKGFPFAQLGLPDNYGQIVPAISVFGFDYDEAFAIAAGKPWTGLVATERLLAESALASGVSSATLRQRLRERYRRIMNSAQWRSNEENSDESTTQN